MFADEPGKDDEHRSGTGNQNEKEHDRSNFYDVTLAIDPVQLRTPRWVAKRSINKILSVDPLDFSRLHVSALSRFCRKRGYALTTQRSIYIVNTRMGHFEDNVAAAS